MVKMWRWLFCNATHRAHSPAIISLLNRKLRPSYVTRGTTRLCNLGNIHHLHRVWNYNSRKSRMRLEAKKLLRVKDIKRQFGGGGDLSSQEKEGAPELIQNTSHFRNGAYSQNFQPVRISYDPTNRRGNKRRGIELTKTSTRCFTWVARKRPLESLRIACHITEICVTVQPYGQSFEREVHAQRRL